MMSLSVRFFVLMKRLNKMQRPFFVDVVIGKRSSVFQRKTIVGQSLLVRRDSLFLLHLLLDVLDGVAGIDLQRDSLARQRPYENLKSHRINGHAYNGENYQQTFHCHTTSCATHFETSTLRSNLAILSIPLISASLLVFTSLMCSSGGNCTKCRGKPQP